MKFRLQHHLILLGIFSLVVFCILMLPIWVMGYPYELPNLAGMHRVITDGDPNFFLGSRMLPWFLLLFSSFFSWGDPLPWISINIVALCISLFPLWWCVNKLAGNRVAWISAVLFPLLPLHFIQALRVDGYVFAYVFLFFSIAFFLETNTFVKNKSVSSKRFAILILLSGLSFGLALAFRDAFILFLPGIVIAAIFFGYRYWRHLVSGLVIFLGVSLFVYSLPIASHVASQDVSIIEKGLLLIGAERSTPSIGHFYPDLYTYEFEKDEYIKDFVAEVSTWSKLDQLGAQNYMQIFGATSSTLIPRILIGSWLIIGSIPSLFLQDYIGGVFLWLFILPGMFLFFKKRRRIFLLLVWLPISLEVVIRYLFLAQRSHLMDYAWVLVIFAGVGIVSITQRLTSNKKNSILIIALITFMVSIQCMQANRSQIARFYNKSNTLNIYAATKAIDSLPADSIVAYPSSIKEYFYLTDTRSIIFAPTTLYSLHNKDSLIFALNNYAVTHAIGYEELLSKLINQHVDIIPMPEVSAPAASSFVSLILHWFR